MANNYAQGTFEPEIPFTLFTESDLTLLDTLGVSVDKGPDGLCYLYNENYCTSGYIVVDGVETEVVEDDLYAMLQEVIKRSNGKIRFISHEQAYTCDKMRKGEFGGSAVFITADDVQYHGTSSWLQRRIAEVETGDTGPDTEDPEAIITEDVIEAINNLIDAAKLVVKRWESGNLAEAVTNLNMVIGWAESTIEAYSPVVTAQPASLVNKALKAAWYFIENVSEDDPERSNKFFELRAQVREAFAALDCNFNGDPAGSLTNTPVNLAIVLDGGLVQAVVTDNPAVLKGVNTMIIDYDTDCLDQDDECLGLVLQQDESLANAYMRGISIDPATVDLGQVANFVSDEACGSTQQRKAICGGYPCEGCPDVNLDGDRCVNESKCLAWTRYHDDK